jgi:hypothetical protein
MAGLLYSVNLELQSGKHGKKISATQPVSSLNTLQQFTFIEV